MAVEKKMKDISRRDFIKTAGAVALAAGMGANIILPSRAKASKKKLKILQWTHTDPDFEMWFWNYCKDWGKKNDTEVMLNCAGH
jgi:anaerobic selenocysteine-containing dehydrogenase